jgi:glyoxylase-like metal-dependent hydrolase (beta-lactamase superfamily II)
MQRFFNPQTRKNEYLVIQGHEAVAIDISDALEDIGQALSGSDIVLKYLLVTHAHPSHVSSLPRLKESFGGMFCLHKHDYDMLEKSGGRLEPDLFVKDRQKLPLGDGHIRVLHTPGHTGGSLCFWLEKAKWLFSGSTLLKDGYGKIWGNSSMSLMLFSLKRLNYTLPSETVVYPRTGEPTTIGKEAWLDCLRSH